MAKLAVQEAIRNKILVGFGIFLLLLLIAGMFLDTGSRDPVYNPARVYLSFVLWSTNVPGDSDGAAAQRVQPAQ